jgi:hypothetical protein
MYMLTGCKQVKGKGVWEGTSCIASAHSTGSKPTCPAVAIAEYKRMETYTHVTSPKPNNTQNLRNGRLPNKYQPSLHSPHTSRRSNTRNKVERMNKTLKVGPWGPIALPYAASAANFCGNELDVERPVLGLRERGWFARRTCPVVSTAASSK